jgi:hypothetical protein
VARRAGVGLAPLDGSRAVNEWAQASALLGAIDYVEGDPLTLLPPFPLAERLASDQEVCQRGGAARAQ